MDTQKPVDGHSFPLLKLPREIRDLIYGEVLLDLPTPSLESLLDRLASHMAIATSESLPIGGDDEGHVDGEENEREEHLQMRERNVVRAFRSEARAFSKDSLKIDTNILLACRQTFAEAKQLLLRRGRFVKVISTNIGLTRLMFASQLCWIDARYSNFAIMTYFLDHNCARYLARRFNPGKLEFLLYGRDVDKFCRAIMGDTAFLVRPPFCPANRHSLAFTTNFHEKGFAPRFLTRDSIHRDVLRPFRRHLYGFPHVSLRGSCVGLRKTLAVTAVRDMKAVLTADPDEILKNIDELLWLCLKWVGKRSYYHTIVPIHKAMDWCRLAVYLPSVWARIQRKARDRRKFVKSMLVRAYALILMQLIVWFKFASQLSNHAQYTSQIMYAYEMFVAAARMFPAAGCGPGTFMEIRINLRVAQALFAHRNTNFKGLPLALGYKTARRAHDLAGLANYPRPRKKELKEVMAVYEILKKSAVRLGTYVEIDDDDDLEERGVVWWSTFHLWV